MVCGAQKYAVHVQVDPNKLATKQLGINDVDAAIQSWNVNIPTGTLYGPQRAFNIQANGQLMNANAFRPGISLSISSTGQPKVGAAVDSLVGQPLQMPADCKIVNGQPYKQHATR